MDCTEGSNMKAPGGFRVSLWSLFSLLVLNCSFFIKSTKSYKNKKEEKAMSTRKSMWFFLGTFVITAWVLGPTIQAGAETMNCKAYSIVVKAEEALIGDVEDHTLSLQTRRGFWLFENGEVATGIVIVMGDYIKGVGSNTSYGTVTFADGSTIITRRQMTVTGSGGASASGALKGEIIKGTGRFEGIKGTITQKTKMLPREKGEPGPKTINEVTITYTLPPK